MTTNPYGEVHTVPTIETRRDHIDFLAHELKRAKSDDRELRQLLGDGAKALMRVHIRLVESKLADLSALQCDCCEGWVPESDLVTVELRGEYEDSESTDEVICPSCITCPPDPGYLGGREL